MNDIITSKPNKFVVPIILVIQIAFLVFLGAQKVEYHIDEIYSYLFANSTQAESFSFADWLIDDWVPGKDYETLTTVQEGEALRYDAPYINTALDCHPPLYYWALHTVCILLPGVLSKWVGLGLNIALFAISQYLLYRTCRLMTKSDWLSLAVIVFYGFSPFAVKTVLYIRMYALLTLLTIGFVYSSLIVLRDGPNIRNMLVCAAILYLGAMTQYYFLVFAFWIALIHGIHLLRKRDIGRALTYGIPLVLAVAAMFVSFPYIVEHVTGTSTNDIGNEVVKSALDFRLWIYQVLALGKLVVTNFCFSKALNIAVLAILLGGIIVLLLRSQCSIKNCITAFGYDVWWFLAAVLLTFLSIAKIGGHNVYLRYIMNLIPVCYLILASMPVRIPIEHQSSKQQIVASMCLLLALTTVVDAGLVCKKGDESFTYASIAQKTAAVVDHNDVPLIFMIARDSDGDVEITGNYTRIVEFDRVFVSRDSDIIRDGILDDCLTEHGACVLYIPTDTYWLDGYKPDVVLRSIQDEYAGLTFAPIMEGGFGAYYLVTA